jgi:hypothetical protein
LNLNFNGLIEAPPVDGDEDSIFGIVTSSEVTLHGLLRNELNLFCHLHAKLEDPMLPLTWWKIHETRFPNVSFVAQQILGILGSQIKTKRTFSIVGVLFRLRCCRLGIDNLDKLVMIMEN